MSSEKHFLPNLIIAGIGKSGTTSLFHYLAQHPDICPSVVKETNYFAPLRYGREPGPLSEYLRYFTHCGDQPYRLEATPTYCYGGRAVITALQTTLPDVRIIINLRDPVERLWASLGYMKSKGLLDERLTLEQYLRHCEGLRAQGVDNQEEHRFYRLSTGFYAEYLGEWLDAFGARLRVVFFERLVTEPRAVVEGLCAWLGIDPSPAASFDYGHHNPTHDHRSRRLKELAFTVREVGDRVFHQHPVLKTRLRALYYRLNGRVAEPPLPPTERRRLEDVFEPYNQPLAALLTAHGYALPDWLSPSEATANDPAARPWTQACSATGGIAPGRTGSP